MKLSQVIEELVEEKGLDKNILSGIITEGILCAYKKKYPELPLCATYNKKTDEIEINIEKKIVNTIDNDDTEISLRKARGLNKDAKLDEMVSVPFEKPIGRIEILKAKQFIAQKIRSIEAEGIYKEFHKKEGSIIVGTIHKCERNGAIVKVGEASAFLPKSLMIPTDKCIVGYTIRALLKEVLKEPRDENQLILDRASADFVKALFELEVPEIFEKLVEIKKVVRVAGYKSKVLVVSNDKNIDPVGTCVGVGGARIKPILRELGSEKIDVIELVSDIKELIKNALKPAHVNRVEIIDDKIAQVWVDEDQRSIAIGKMGQNISLASQLVGMNIDLVKNDSINNDSINLDNLPNEEIE